MGYTLAAVDADVAFLQSPLPLLEAAASSGADLTFMRDGADLDSACGGGSPYVSAVHRQPRRVRIANTGFFLARRWPSVRAREWAPREPPSARDRHNTDPLSPAAPRSTPGVLTAIRHALRTLADMSRPPPLDGTDQGALNVALHATPAAELSVDYFDCRAAQARARAAFSLHDPSSPPPVA